MGLKAIAKKVSARFNFTTGVSINGKKFKNPIIRNMGFLNLSVKDDWFLELLKKLKLPKDSDFIDIGVNVGQTLLTFRSCYDNPYWGFEPNPNCVYYLGALIKSNNFRNTNILPVGLSSSGQLAKFYVKHESDSAGTIVKDLRPGYYTEEEVNYVPLFALDQLNVEGIRNVSLIKIDVEGAELEVLSGMTQTITQHQPIIICEVLDSHSAESLKPMQEKANRLTELMKSVNYSLFRIVHTGHNIRLEAINSIELKIWSEESWNLNDYLFAPAGRQPVL